MEAKHTPGPWRQAHVVSAYERKRRVIIASEESQHSGIPVCEVYGVNDEDCVANATLIAAAPELAECVRDLHDFSGPSTHRHADEWNAAIIRAGELLKRVGA